MAQTTRVSRDVVSGLGMTTMFPNFILRHGSQTPYVINPIRYPPPSGDMRLFVQQNGDVYVIFPLRDPGSGILIVGEVILDAFLAVVEWCSALGGGMTTISSANYSSGGLGNGYYFLQILHANVPALTGTNGQLTMRVQTRNAVCEDINIFVGPVDTNVVTVKGGSNPIDANVVQVQGVGSAATNLMDAPLMGGALMTPFTSITITTGTETGSVANIAAADGSYDIITQVAGATDFYYEVTLTSQPATHVNWTGYLISLAETNSANVYAWNWGAAAWDQIGLLRSNANPDAVNQNHAWPLDTAHTGTGGDLGKVRVRFTSAIVTGTSSVRTDRMLAAGVAAISTAGLALTTDVTTATSTLAADIATSTSTTAGNISSAITTIDNHTDSAVSTLATAAALATDTTTITTAVTSAVTAINAHTDSDVAPLATAATLATDTAAILAAIASGGGGGGTVNANVIQWLGTTPNALIAGRVDVDMGDSQANAIDTDTFTQAARLGLFGVVYDGTIASSADANHVVLNTGTGISTVDGVYKNGILAILSPTGTPSFALITNYVGSTKTCTLDGQGLVISPASTPTAFILRFGIQSGNVTATDISNAVTTINAHTDSDVAPLTATLALILGLHRHNAVLDGGSGHASAQYNSNKLMVAARLRVFATATLMAAATKGAADGADSEIQRYTLVGTDDGTGLLANFTLAQVFP